MVACYGNSIIYVTVLETKTQAQIKQLVTLPVLSGHQSTVKII